MTTITTTNSTMQSNEPGEEEYEPSSLYGTDYYCPNCWQSRGVKQVLDDVVEKQGRKEVFKFLFCVHCHDVLGSREVYDPQQDDLEAYRVGGELGYPDEEE